MHEHAHTLSVILLMNALWVSSVLFSLLSLPSMWLGIYYRCLLHCCMQNLLSQNQVFYVCKDLSLQLNEYEKAQNIYSRVDCKETTQICLYLICIFFI